MPWSRKTLKCLLISLVIIIVLFFIFNVKTIISYDQEINSFFLSARQSGGITFFKIITLLGETYFIFFAIALITIFLYFFKKSYAFLYFWLAGGGTGGSLYLIKKFVGRPRPLSMAVNESTFSFPSGHSAISVAFYGLAAYFLFLALPDKRARIILTLTTIFLILIIGFSRLYLGVHYFSDVLGGYILGGCFLLISIFVHRRVKSL